VWRGRRSDLLLGALAAVAVANGLLLGLSLYGLLAAALKVVHGHLPPLGYAWLAGSIAGIVLLGMSLQRARMLREGEPALWFPIPPEHPIVPRFRALASASSLSTTPALCWVNSAGQNAFTVGRSRDDATIVLTAGLIERLEQDEMEAVLAQQLAHVESEDLKAVGLADAVADSIGELARTKGKFLWGPRAIVEDLRPFLIVSAFGLLLVSALPSSGGESGGLTLLLGLVSLALLYALWVAAKRSWRGLAQLFLLISFFGPLSLVEAALAPPTAVVLSRLVSRARIHEADARAVELAGTRDGLVSALERLEAVERSPASPWLEGRRFSLFVAARPQGGYQAWLAHLYSSHPSISSRQETIRALS
jgi:Zn-dependent protease with chaperone function